MKSFLSRRLFFPSMALPFPAGVSYSRIYSRGRAPSRPLPRRPLAYPQKAWYNSHTFSPASPETENTWLSLSHSALLHGIIAGPQRAVHFIRLGGRFGFERVFRLFSLRKILSNHAIKARFFGILTDSRFLYPRRGGGRFFSSMGPVPPGLFLASDQRRGAHKHPRQSTRGAGEKPGAAAESR